MDNSATFKINREHITKIKNQNAIEGGQAKVFSLCAEELTELAQALLRFVNRKPVTSNKICEEIADVYLTLEQVRQTMDLSDEELNELISAKVERTMERLNIKG